MSLIPWRRNQPSQQQQQLSPLSPFPQDFQRLVDRFFSGFPMAGFPVGYEAFANYPAINVSDVGDALQVQAEVPGLDADDLEISVEGDMLLIKGEKKAEKEEKQENYYYAERSFGSFIRRIELPSSVDSNKADAQLNRGVLTLRLPKLEAQMTKTIKVKGATGELGGQKGNIGVQGQGAQTGNVGTGNVGTGNVGQGTQRQQK